MQTSTDDRKETAAAIARIVLFNDIMPTSALQGLVSMNGLADAAVAEWSRIQRKYGETHPVLMSIDIGYLYIMGALARLGKPAYSLRDQPSYL